MQSFSGSHKKLNMTAVGLTAILLIGLSLRFYHLGYNSFWLDEAGVAYAAGADTLVKMLAVVRSHVLAMPFDYFVVWLVGRISTQEFALRIPAALWGVGSLYVAYRLYRRFVSPAPALLSLLVLAFSPLHIQYSQELRFYSSFVFFYLFSTLLLFDVLQAPSRKRWLIFILACLIGIYFHPYVLFAIVNGVVWLALKPQNNTQVRSQRSMLLLSAILCLLAFLVGYLTFSASNTFKIPLMVFEDSSVKALAIGLGWLPFYARYPGLPWIWGLLCAVLEVVGVSILLKTSRRSLLAGFFYSIMLQLVAVLGADLLQHYFFAPRQLLMLLPLLCLFAGIGANAILDKTVHWLHSIFVQWQPESVRRIVAILIVSILVLASIPAILFYEQDDKGNTRTLSEIIIQEWKPGDTFLITPPYDGFVYKYYMENVYHRLDIGSRLFTADWQNILTLKDQSGSIFLVTPYELTQEEDQQLRDLGYLPQYHSYPQSRYAKTLWVQSK